MNLLIDTFIFFDELELLEFRLKELDSVVDYFVLVESDLTFTGEEKPLHFQRNKHMFEQYRDRIIHVVHSSPFKNQVNPWQREIAQRNAGWHLSYFGGADRLIAKIRSYSHQEYNKPEYLDLSRIESAIKNNEDLFGRNFITLKHVPLDSNKNLPANYKMLLQSAMVRYI